MRDYLLTGIILGSLPVGLFRPFWGLLFYTWISCMYPHELTWSFARTLPVAKLSAISVMAGLLLNPRANFSLLRSRENVAVFLLWCTFTLSTIFSYYPDVAWGRWQDVSKILVMGTLASVLLNDRSQIRQFLLVIALSLGFYGFKGGIFGIVTGGNQMVYGPGDSVIGANNAIGLALNMAVPILWYMAREEKRWLKTILQITAILSIPAIMFTYSRASAYTIGVLLLVTIFKSRYWVVLATAVVIVGFAIVPFIPQKWFARQETVMTYEEDGSAMSRIDNWQLCWRLALDRPLTGAGFYYMTPEVFAKYAPEFLFKYNGKTWDSHNVLMGMLATHGFPGLFAFLTMNLFCLGSCARLKRQSRGRPELRWVSTYTEMIQLSFLAFFINGMFVNMEYFDLVYLLVAVVTAMKFVVSRDQAKAEELGNTFVEPSLAAAGA